MISATVLSKNNAKTVRKTLDSLVFFQEIILLDTGSEDETLSIAREYPNVKIFTHDFTGFGPLHNVASDLAENDWIFSIDSDEVVSPALKDFLQNPVLDPDCVYTFPRRNFFKEKWIKGCGWSPDRQARLFHRKKTSFTLDLVHETVKRSQLKETPLPYPIDHYSYLSYGDFLQKMQTYTSLFADQNALKKSSSPTKAFFHGAFAFFKSYLLKKGFRDGFEGFLISSYNAQTSFYKYLKLYEVNQEAKKDFF